MQESLLPRVSETLGSSSLVDLIFTRAENQMDTWKPDGTKIMQEFQGFDNEDFDVTKCLFDDVQNSKLRFMTCREVFLFGLEFTDQPSVTNWLATPETKLVVVLLLLPALQPAPISNSLLERREKSVRGGGKLNSIPPGLNDPYGIDIVPLNFFGNQIIPVGVHNISKSFSPNMAAIRVLSLGTKFIPK